MFALWIEEVIAFSFECCEKELRFRLDFFKPTVIPNLEVLL